MFWFVSCSAKLENFPVPIDLFAYKAKKPTNETPRVMNSFVISMFWWWLIIFGSRQVNSKTKIRRAGILTPFNATLDITDDSVEFIMSWPKFLSNGNVNQGSFSCFFSSSPQSKIQWYTHNLRPSQAPVLMPTLSQSRNKGVIYFQFLAISKETKYYI